MKSLLLVVLGFICCFAAQPTDDERKMVENLKAKTEAGDPEAQLETARYRKNGALVPKDEVQDFAWCRRAAESLRSYG